MRSLRRKGRANTCLGAVVIKSFDLNRAFRTVLGLIIATTLALLVIAAILVVKAEHRLLPLQQDIEVLSKAEASLLKRLDLQNQPPSGQAADQTNSDSGLIDAVESLSKQIQINLDDLQLAQENFLSLTRSAAGGIVFLALMLALLTWLFNRRILAPMQVLSELLRRLARQQYVPYPLDNIDLMLHPIFASFNSLVNRLDRLEKTNENRQDELELRVQSAVGALVAQRAHLAKAEQMAAVGEMAAKLAHDIRNPLASIRAACSSLREESKDPDAQERLDLVIQEVDRLVKIVAQQLDQARHDPEPSTLTNVAELIRDTTELLSYQLPDNLQVELILPDCLEVHLPPEGLRRSLLNLVLNAKQVIEPESGRIQIQLDCDLNHWWVEVRDSGPGFPQQMVETGVRSFLTTRAHGTGLGLSMVRRYTEEQGGKLTLANPAGGGGSVQLKFPIRSNGA